MLFSFSVSAHHFQVLHMSEGSGPVSQSMYSEHIVACKTIPLYTDQDVSKHLIFSIGP